MKGLIIKDIKLLARSVLSRRLLAICILFFAFLTFALRNSSGLFLSVFLGMWGSFDLTGTLTFDERSGWVKQERMLPLSLKQKVGAKYLLIIPLLIAGSLLITLAALLIHILFPAPMFSDIGTLLTVFTCITLGFSAVSFPLSYHFGAKPYMFRTLALALSGVLLLTQLENGALISLLKLLPFSKAFSLGFVHLAALIIYLISFFVSCKLYKPYIDSAASS